MKYEDFFHRVFKMFDIRVTSVCNLHCKHCGNLSHIPISRSSPWVWRRKAWRMPVETLSLFTQRFRGIGEPQEHRIIGGEATMLPVKDITALMDVLWAKGRTMTILTNGFGLMSLPQFYVRRFSKIRLNDHGPNFDVTEEVAAWLREFYEGTFQYVRNYRHHDLQLAIERSTPRSDYCKLWLKYPTLNFTGTIHPCCGTVPLMLHLNDTVMEDELRAAGWHVENPDIIDVLRNWKETIPPYVKEQCLTRCFYPVMQTLPPQLIGPDPRNRLQRETGLPKNPGSQQ